MKVRDNASQEWIEILAVKGDKGDKGDTGETGKGISSAVINSSGNLIITYTDGTAQNAGKVQTSGGGSGGGGGTVYETITVSTSYTLVGLQLANGSTYENTYRLTSNFIAVEEGDEITFSADGDNWQVSGCVYTTDKTWVAGFPSDTWEQLGTYTAGGTGYFRATFRQGGYQGTQFTTADGAKCHITIRRAKPSSGGDAKIIVNRFNLSNARSQGNDVFITLPVEPNTQYTFDAKPYTWVGVNVDGTVIGHTASNQVINFTTGSTTTEVICQFYPGFAPSSPTDDRIDYSTLSFYKTEGETIAEAFTAKQDKLIAGTGITIKNNIISATGGTIRNNIMSATGGSGGGKVDTVLNQSSENAIANSAVTIAITDMEVNINSIITTLNGFLKPTKYNMPCASGFTNFTGDSVYWKTPDGIVHITAIVTVNSTCNADTNVFTMPSGYRPAATIVIPCTAAYESNHSPLAGGINFNSDGTCKYYGDSLPSGRHIMINAVYPSTDTVNKLSLDEE